jgi:hypothetical protein
VAFTQDNEVIEALATDGVDEPFGVRILPGRLGRGEDLPDTKCRLVVYQAEHFLDQAGDQPKVEQREVVNPFDPERVLREVVA